MSHIKVNSYLFFGDKDNLRVKFRQLSSGKCNKMSEKNENLSQTADHPLSNRDPNNKTEWVKFEEEDEKVIQVNY